MKTRAEALSQLLSYRSPMGQILADINEFSWDSDITLVVLTPQHMRNILTRYLNAELTDMQLQDWANAIEGREDIAYLSSHKEWLEEAIFQLANPLLSQPISSESVAALLERVNDLKPLQ